MSKKDEVQQSPKLTVPQVIEYCKNDLGITFNLMNEEKAKNFLQKRNYFFRSESEYTKRFDSIRRIRNACAHNVCTLCSFKPVQKAHFGRVV